MFYISKQILNTSEILNVRTGNRMSNERETQIAVYIISSWGRPSQHGIYKRIQKGDHHEIRDIYVLMAAVTVIKKTL